MPELHLEILRQPQRRLWDRLQRDSATIEAHGFLLAGGTALALQIGHRESHDFDFFSQTPGIDPILRWLEPIPGFLLRDADRDTVHGEIGGVKVSFIAAYRYPFIMPPVSVGSLSMADVADIALMKMLAITHRATLRDYLDLAVILRDHCSLSSLIQRSREKYGPAFNVMPVLRAMTHSADLDGEMPVMLDSDLTSRWQGILRDAVRNAA